MYNSTSGSICSEVVPMQEEALLEGDKMDEAQQWAFWEKQLVDEGFEPENRPGRLRDIERSRKFYLRRRDPTNELEDVFVERSSEDYDESDGEEILQVVWFEGGDEDPIMRTSDLSPTAARKKSNSKFTLSVTSDMTSSLPDDDSSGDDLSDGESVVVGGRFLEAKDSIEVMATSSKSLRSGHNKSSDWDEPTVEEVSCVWYSEEQANEDGVSREGQLIEAKEGVECLEVLANVEGRRSGIERTKKVSFYESYPSDESVRSEEMLSLCRQLDEVGEKLISDTVVERPLTESVGEASSKSTTSNCSSLGKGRTNKRVSFHDLPKDDSWYEEKKDLSKAEDSDAEQSEEQAKVEGKAKRVSFHKLYLGNEELPLGSPCLQCFDNDQDGACTLCGASIYRASSTECAQSNSDLTSTVETLGKTEKNGVASLQNKKEVRNFAAAETSEETIRSVLVHRPCSSSSSPFLPSSDCESPAESDLSTLDLTTSFPGRKVLSAADFRNRGSQDISNVNFFEMSHFTLSQNENIKDLATDKLDHSTTEYSSGGLFQTVEGISKNDSCKKDKNLNIDQVSAYHENDFKNNFQGEDIMPDIIECNLKKVSSECIKGFVKGLCTDIVGGICEVPDKTILTVDPENNSDADCEKQIRENAETLIIDLHEPICVNRVEVLKNISSTEIRMDEDDPNKKVAVNLKQELENNHDPENVEINNLDNCTTLYDADKQLNMNSTRVSPSLEGTQTVNSADVNEHNDLFSVGSVLRTEKNNKAAKKYSINIEENLSEADSDLLLKSNTEIPEYENADISLAFDVLKEESPAVDIDYDLPQSICTVDGIHETAESQNLLYDKVSQPELPDSESSEVNSVDDKTVVGVFSCEVQHPSTCTSSDCGFSYQGSFEETYALQNQGLSQSSCEKCGSVSDKGIISRPEDGALGSGDDWPNLPSTVKGNQDAPLECPAGDLCLKDSACEVHCVQDVHYSAEEYESADSDSSGFVTP